MDRLDPRLLADWVAGAQAAADVAGAVIRPFFRNGLNAAHKHDRSPVTIADRAAEQAMRAVLAERFPDHGVLGEEFGHDRAGAEFTWVLDPIDGTRAFITGRPVFGTLIGLMQGETPIIGIIDQPITGERWIGALGQPTRFTGPYPGRPGTRPCASLAEAELSLTSPEMLGPADNPGWNRLAKSVRRVSFGGDCYAYGLLALGQIDIIAECDLKIWDWAALVPIVEGAGGSLTDWTGQKLHPGNATHALALGNPTLLPAAITLLG